MLGLRGLGGMACRIMVSALALAGCARAPSPLAPHLRGSIGVPHSGVLTSAAELPKVGAGYRWLKDGEHHWALPRVVRAIERAAARVERERPGASLSVGDLSARGGGQLFPHLSHRTGRDADLLLYLTTLEGEPIDSPGFVRVGADGLGWDAEHKRFVRLDVERQWLLVRALVDDPDARVQWLFVSRTVESLLVEWARARGEPSSTIVRAMDVMLQPAPPAQAHDDHVHLRSSCDVSDVANGCEPTGPERAWLTAASQPRSEAIDELLEAILRPLQAEAPSDLVSDATSRTSRLAPSPLRTGESGLAPLAHGGSDL